LRIKRGKRTLDRCVITQNLRQKFYNSVGWHYFKAAQEYKPSRLLHRGRNSQQAKELLTGRRTMRRRFSALAAAVPSDCDIVTL
jgi:hypothetical protein